MSDMTITFGFRSSPKVRRALDLYRRDHEDPPSRSEAIRILLCEALKPYFVKMEETVSK
jgi:hypothetical protein